ncbi:NAD(P)-dependent oxidoreductase [Kitasatospora camelliae]|uniref:NAD(P)H-binding protein n=1 Tax=Kitasatospora camelliae TaxID=3156397 RepID=A0AAU8JT56_9ACTN
MARIAVIGANGNIGRCIVTEALSRGHEVLAVVRDPDRYQGLAIAVVPGDVLDPEDVARVAAGQDVLVSAVGGGDGPGRGRLIEPAAHALVAGLRELGAEAPRLIVVGGSGSGGTGVPAAEPGARVGSAHRAALAYYATVCDLSWTVLSPAAALQPGERTGHYRTDSDTTPAPESAPADPDRISIADYAVALLDEIENPRHIGERFTCGH